MSKLFTVLVVLMALTGCSTFFKPKLFMPPVPVALQQPCPELGLLKVDAKPSETVSTIAANYGLYHECALKTAEWIEWYATQKSILK